MKRDFTTTLLIPTLNEVEGMKVIMPQIDHGWVDQILFVDGGSTDGTIEYIREHGYELCIQRTPGVRMAYMDVLPMVRGDVILTFSPDGNSIPEIIPQLLDKMSEGYDMVISSRYLGDAKSADDDIITAFGNWMFTKSANTFFRANYTDVMVMLRAYKTSLIHDLELDQDKWYTTPEKLFGCEISWEPLLSARAAKRRLKITEIPGDEPERIGGERKLRILGWGAAYYFQFIRELFLWK